MADLATPSAAEMATTSASTDKPAVVKPERPDEAAFQAESEKRKKAIDKAQEEVVSLHCNHLFFQTGSRAHLPETLTFTLLSHVEELTPNCRSLDSCSSLRLVLTSLSLEKNPDPRQRGQRHGRKPIQ